MKIMVINGPNLDFLGIREPGVYGTQSYADLENKIEQLSTHNTQLTQSQIVNLYPLPSTNYQS